jgi:ribosomal protein S18 acetylase RimI-like enzyme
LDERLTGHPLDNPLWNALGGSLAQYSRVFGGVRLLDPDIGSVAAMEQVTPANVSALASAIPYGSEILAIAPEPIPPTAELEVVHIKQLLQMVAERLTPVESSVSVDELRATDFPQMLALVEITRPGPLGPRALELGGFRGIFDGDKLVALAGERLHLDGYTEIATVCTHPGYRGRNYGKAVVSAVAQGIVESGQTPFLGVNADNIPAIRLYERLGFTHRTTLYLNTVKRPLPANETEATLR